MALSAVDYKNILGLFNRVQVTGIQENEVFLDLIGKIRNELLSPVTEADKKD